MSPGWSDFSTEACECGRDDWPPALWIDTGQDLSGSPFSLHWDGQRWFACEANFTGHDRASAVGRRITQEVEAACAEANAVPFHVKLTMLLTSRQKRLDAARRLVEKATAVATRRACEVAIASLGTDPAAQVAWALLQQGWAGTPKELVATARAVAS